VAPLALLLVKYIPTPLTADVLDAPFVTLEMQLTKLEKVFCVTVMKPAAKIGVGKIKPSTTGERKEFPS
jgi:hypothetical protein